MIKFFMSGFQALLIWFGGLIVVGIMFEAGEALGGFLGNFVIGFTIVVIFYVTGVFGNKN